jgi:hypothetical protein
MTSLAATAPANPAGVSPLRRANSIRRTSSIDTDWPQGFGTPMRMHGAARDLLTLSDVSRPKVIAQDEVEIWASMRREITAISSSRLQDIAQLLIGRRAGGNFRQSVAALFAGEQQRATPLHLLLDDFSGASLVAGWAWSRWMENAYERRKEKGGITAGRNGTMTGVCIGFRPGSSGLSPDGTANRNQSSTEVPPLSNSADSLGWHEMPEQPGVGMRRARRMDVWFEGDLRMDIGFQDSATSPAGGRIAVHEYRVQATADPDTLMLRTIHAQPHVLPYPECPGAAHHMDRLLGFPLPSLRAEVSVELAGILGCTHLNDVLRSMSDAPALARQLREAAQDDR